MKSEIQKYYDRSFKTEEMPTFDELTPEQVLKIKNTIGFAGWKFANAVKAFNKAFYNLLPEGIKPV